MPPIINSARNLDGAKAKAGVEQWLAAILSVDVAEYGRLMGVGAEGTGATLEAHLREPIEPKIAAHRGRIVRTTDDGCIEPCNCLPLL